MRWYVVTTEESVDVEGNVLPVGTVINEILWDGVTPITPPPGTELRPAD